MVTRYLPCLRPLRTRIGYGWWRRWRVRRNYVSQLARDIGISRPLLHLHLQKLEEAGLVTSRMELSSEGKALNYYEVCNFALTLTPAAILAAAKTLSSKLDLRGAPLYENMIYAAFFFPAAAAVLVFGMKYVSAVAEARVRLAQDGAYHALAAQAAAAQAEMTAALVDIRSRLEGIDKILKDVG